MDSNRQSSHELELELGLFWNKWQRVLFRYRYSLAYNRVHLQFEVDNDLKDQFRLMPKKVVFLIWSNW